MATRAVMKESWKWRSGRERDLVVAHRPSGRGGNTPHTFGDDERIAAEDDRDVVMPGGEAAAFEVVEAELTLEVFIQALGAVSLLDEPHEPLPATGRRHRREEVLGRLALAVRPLDDEPH